MKSVGQVHSLKHRLESWILTCGVEPRMDLHEPQRALRVPIDCDVEPSEALVKVSFGEVENRQ